MANWSNSWLTFQGEETKVQQAKQLFKEMSSLEVQTKLGQIPDFVKEKDTDGWFHNIMVDETDIVSFDAKWAPPIETLKKIGETIGVNFTLDYEELGNHLFGKAIYDHATNELKTYKLESKDFKLYKENKDETMYIYKRKQWESEYEILEMIFEDKFGFSY